MVQLVPDVQFQFGSRLIDAKKDPYGFLELVLRKGAHLLLYGILAAGMYLLLAARGVSPLRAGALAVLAVALFAGLDEWNQSGRWRRYGSVHDIAIDLAGAAAGILAAAALSRNKGQRKTVRPPDPEEVSR